MKIGVPKEIKPQEYRVGMSPAGVRQLVAHGHEVLVEAGAGVSSGYSDEAYVRAGAKIVPDGATAWNEADMVVKVKEPLPEEFAYFRPGLVLYTYLHLAAFPELTRALLEKGVRGVAYETITDDDGGLPLLRPMSEIAGRMATQVGAKCLEREIGGKGILLGGVPGTRRGRVVILGGGVVGTAAARIAIGMGAKVTVLDINAARMAYLEDVFGNHIETLYSNPESIDEEVRRADLVIGAVLVPGAAAPKLVTEEHLREMEDGSVVVDVAVDQGGSIATCHPTTHDAPTYVVEGIVHYCVANMPGAVPQTSTVALTNATIRYALEIADEGLEQAIASNPHLARGVNTFDGKLTCKPVAEAHGLEYTPLEAVR
ncbi:MAG: alanine dehydrogenase [Deltaproteobacteria bacterium]|nr:MAG: alanine dehydrogenase [Deltaproteobacteria bacterium]